MDIATIVGLVAGFGLLLWSILLGADLLAYFDLPSAIMVFGGFTCTALISFPLPRLRNLLSVLRNCFFTRPADPVATIHDMVAYAEKARRDGILSLEHMTENIADPFIVSGLHMAVDGADPRLIAEIMNHELEAVAARHADGKAILDNLAKYAPAFGMIGTLIGMVQMLRNVSNPSQIGPGMAVAILTTLYGVVIANLVCGPLAEKLALRSREEIAHKTMVIRGIMAIQSGDNPRVVEKKLATFLPHGRREIGSVEKARAA